MLGKNQASIFVLVLSGYSLYSKKVKSHFKLTYITCKTHFAQILTSLSLTWQQSNM